MPPAYQPIWQKLSIHCQLPCFLFPLVVLVFACQVAVGHDVEQDRGETEPDYARRLARVQYLQQYKMSEGLRQRAAFKVRRAALEAANVPPREASRMLTRGRQFAFPFPAQPELKSQGAVKTLTVLVDFKNYRAGTELPSRSDFEANIYGTGTAIAQSHIPYESVHNYYSRASEGIVDVQGDVLDWHHFGSDREEYEPEAAPPGPFQNQQQAFLDNQALFDMATDVLAAQDDSHDFAQYDNDHDGDIDLITILYAGPRGSWSSFWWAYRWEFFVPDAGTTTFDGKRVKQFVFQFIDERPGTNDFNPRTLIHEMGHAFGLADYYDYDPTVGPPGGVGGLDMMHSNWGNHCAFSRWLLDWIRPEIIGDAVPSQHTLVASGSPSAGGVKAVAVFPGLADITAPSTEMFIIENRHQVGNDGHSANTPASGVLIWHVDASVNPSADDFANDNSFADHKLIRLVRADSPNDFGASEHATANTYFKSGSDFTATSSPSSVGISGMPTHVAVQDISAPAELMTVNVGITTPNGPPERMAAAEGTEDDLLKSATDATELGVDFDALGELDSRLATVTPKQIQNLWNSTKSAAADAKEGQQPWLAQQLILTRWSSKDGKAAVEALMGVPNAEFVRQSFPIIMQAWATNDPARASEWYFAEPQKKLRSSGELQPGAEFAEKLFYCETLRDPARAVKQLDQLGRVAEISGALKGLQHGHELLGAAPEKIRAEYENLSKNKAIVEKVQQLREAIESVDIGEIENQTQRRELQQLFLQGGP